MKGRGYILILLLVFGVMPMMPGVGEMSAQPRLREPEMYVGVHGGVQASTVIFKPSVENMSPFTDGVVIGGDGGFVFRYAGHKVCGFQIELNYMHRGWREKSDAGVYTRRLHYLELPLLTHLYFGKKAVRGFVNLGPQIGYCLGDTHSGVEIGGANAYEYKAVDSKFDWGVALGFGLYGKTEKAGVYQIEIRGNYSLGGVYGTRTSDHFSMASPLDVGVNLAWMWPVK